MTRIPKDIARRIVDPYAFADWNRCHEAFTTLRREMPLAVAEPDGYDPFWVVSRYDDLQAIERDSDLFHNADRPTTLLTRKAHELVTQMMGDVPLIRSLVQMDNPDHAKYRQLTHRWFGPQNLRKLEGRIREIAEEFTERMLGFDGECDFARDVAFLYPLRVVMEVIGVPESDEPLMLKLTQELFGARDPDINRAGAVLSEEEGIRILREVVDDFFNYFNALSEDRRKNPREDLATLIANAEIAKDGLDRQPIPFHEAMSYYVIAATAGHDTTSASTASGGWVLAERPDLFAELKQDPSLLAGFIEETIRWETPVKHFMRTATDEAEISGQTIAQGDWLYLSYVSANRDEDHFESPFEFDPRRKPNRQIAFGYGPHVCLGQHLARMEMRILWQTLLPRLDSIELAGEPTRTVANFVCGPKSVPVRFQAA